MTRDKDGNAVTSFTPEQKAFIREVVFEASPTIIGRHVESCPWGKKVSRAIWIGIGIGICLGVLGISTLPAFVNAVRSVATFPK